MTPSYEAVVNVNNDNNDKNGKKILVETKQSLTSKSGSRDWEGSYGIPGASHFVITSFYQGIEFGSEKDVLDYLGTIGITIGNKISEAPIAYDPFSFRPYRFGDAARLAGHEFPKSK